jgi:hypothetical protein
MTAPRDMDELWARRSPTHELELDLDDVGLCATLTLPPCATGLVLLPSVGSSDVPRALAGGDFARALGQVRMGVLRFDLLTMAEDADAEADLHYEIPFLARRLRSVARWAASEAGPGPLPLAFVATGTGAAAALLAAADEPGLVSAVVSFEGRADLARHALPRVDVPTLAIDGSHDVAGLVSGWLADQMCGREPRRARRAPR